MASLTAAVVQMRSGTDPAANLARLEDLVAQAVAQGADFVQTPEMTGMLCRDRAHLFAHLKAQDEDPIVAGAAALAARHGIVLHLGSTAVAVGEGRAANRSLLFGPDGAVLATYDKIHMFDVDLDNGESWRESRTYQPGDCARVVDIDAKGTAVRLGLAVCYDIRFAHLFSAQALAEAQVLTAPAAFTRQTGEAHWHVLLRARAIENGAFMIAAAQGGRHDDGRETFGHSLIVDPWGRILAEVDGDEPGVALARIDLDEVETVRSRIPALKNRRAFSEDFPQAARA